MTTNIHQHAFGYVSRCLQHLRSRIKTPRARDWAIVQQIRAVTAGMASLSDRALAEHANDLRYKVQSRPTMDAADVVVPGFALVSEATRRTLDVCLYEEQLLAGLVLIGRNVAEMQTGEGKTYAASLPAFLHALRGHGVHIVTANDYLAMRDYELLAPVFHKLGVSVGLLSPDASIEEKQQAYAADVTYGADQEFGFDYLRDHLRAAQDDEEKPGQRYLAALRRQPLSGTPKVQRELVATVVDEIDSILLDSSTSPLLLSRQTQNAQAETPVYFAAQTIADELVPEEDYSLDRNTSGIRFTQAGLKKIFSGHAAVSQYDLRRPWPIYVEQAILAKRVLRRDVDYVVRDGRALLVDEYTGRILPQRQWREGLHQSIELKEGLTVRTESFAVARISKQRYFRLYRHLCGMTGTAHGSQREFWDVYQLRVVTIPPRKPCRRTMLPLRLFADEQRKYDAIVAEIEEIHRKGQPILVGARTIENSQRLATALDARGIAYRLLNGKQDLTEATVVARAGEVRAVTIATNMAGRGTDIRLGVGAAGLGGLHVVVTEQHESVRIDRQLMGRCARQGDPGSFRIFGSAQDPLIEKHVPRVARLMKRLANDAGEVPLDLAPVIAWVQRHVEWQHYQARRRLLRFDNWLDSLVRHSRT